jgi:hypothetical protein
MSSKRLLVSLEEDILNDIIELAKNNRTSSSKVAGDLIKASLEIEEDRLFAKLADERLGKTKEWFSHEDAWK